jgi:phosphatidylglycerol lysyltransferase
MPIRRIPFTAGTIAVLLVTGLLTGAMFTRVSDHPWGNDVAYGLPAFLDGRIWTLVTGALFAVTPLCYVATSR